MRRIYLITYDICDPKRLRQVYKCLRNWGDHLQYSVFECQLTAADLLRCKAELSQRIDHRHDQVLVIDLGPVTTRSDTLVQAVGKPYSPIAASCLIV